MPKRRKFKAILQPGGYVYLIQNSTNRKVKIGCTRKSPSHRLRQLQTGSSEKLQLLHQIACDVVACEYFEARLHQIFGHTRGIGEWFSLSVDAINWLQGIRSVDELY